MSSCVSYLCGYITEYPKALQFKTRANIYSFTASLGREFGSGLARSLRRLWFPEA